MIAHFHAEKRLMALACPGDLRMRLFKDLRCHGIAQREIPLGIQNENTARESFQDRFKIALRLLLFSKATFQFKVFGFQFFRKPLRTRLKLAKSRFQRTGGLRKHLESLQEQTSFSFFLFDFLQARMKNNRLFPATDYLQFLPHGSSPARSSKCRTNPDQRIPNGTPPNRIAIPVPLKLIIREMAFKSLLFNNIWQIWFDRFLKDRCLDGGWKSNC